MSKKKPIFLPPLLSSKFVLYHSCYFLAFPHEHQSYRLLNMVNDIYHHTAVDRNPLILDKYLVHDLIELWKLNKTKKYKIAMDKLSIINENYFIGKYSPSLVLFEQSNCIDWIYFVIYGHWSRYSLSGTWCILNENNKRYKCRLHREHPHKQLRATLVSAFF